MAIEHTLGRLPCIRRLPRWADLLLTFALSVAVFAPLCSALLGFHRVSSGSMLQTIQLDDRILGERVSYRLHAPAAGDIVTCKDPERAGATLIKRVIATEGQVVDLRDGVVYVDGRELDEPYVRGQRTDPTAAHAAFLPAGISYPHTVAAGCVWLMGDNRAESLDSRFFGDVPVASVLSRALFVYWPLEHVGALG